MGTDRRRLKLLATAACTAAVLALTLGSSQEAVAGEICGTCSGLELTKALNTSVNPAIVVAINQDVPSVWAFDIEATNTCGQDVLVLDTVPSELTQPGSDDQLAPKVECLDPDTTGIGQCDPTTSDCPCGTAAFIRQGKGNKPKNNQRGASQLAWSPEFEIGDPTSSIQVTVATRGNRGKGKQGVTRYQPKSCGALWLNHGATIWDATGEGDAVLCNDTDGICVTAVDPDLGAVVPDGTGDIDGDGLADWVEGCAIGTNPCQYDANFVCDGGLTTIGTGLVCDGCNDCTDGTDEPWNCPASDLEPFCF